MLRSLRERREPRHPDDVFCRSVNDVVNVLERAVPLRRHTLPIAAHLPLALWIWQVAERQHRLLAALGRGDDEASEGGEESGGEEESESDDEDGVSEEDDVEGGAEGGAEGDAEGGAEGGVEVDAEVERRAEQIL